MNYFLDIATAKALKMYDNLRFEKNEEDEYVWDEVADAILYDEVGNIGNVDTSAFFRDINIVAEIAEVSTNYLEYTDDIWDLAAIQLATWSCVKFYLHFIQCRLALDIMDCYDGEPLDQLINKIAEDIEELPDEELKDSYAILFNEVVERNCPTRY